MPISTLRSHRAISSLLMSNNNTLATRFPTPSRAPHPLSPGRWPGISPQTTEALKASLKDNHQRWHVFFNDHGFHNHAAHRMIALWAVGASAHAINDGYKRDCGYERAAIQSPQPITDANFDEHLGDHQYYQGYLEFFADYIEKHSLGKALEDWVFSPRANLGANLVETKQPRMLARFVSGILHPIIHAGYGAEFGLPGMMAEGLAQCAVHSAETSALVPPSLFEPAAFSVPAEGKERLTALEILGRVYDELHEEVVKKKGGSMDFDTTVGEHATPILKLASQWELDVDKLAQDEYLTTKIEEIVFLVVSLYGVTGLSLRAKDQTFRADFVLMHLVTSSVFLPSECALISPIARARLLRTYLVTAYSIYAFLRCPALDFTAFYAHTAPEGSGGRAQAEGNPWFPIMDHAMEHHDEHLVKTQRALSAWASHFGVSKTAFITASAGDSTRGLVGLEKLDGSVFLKTAQLTMARVGPPRKEHLPFSRPTEWDFPFFPSDV